MRYFYSVEENEPWSVEGEVAKQAIWIAYAYESGDYCGNGTFMVAWGDGTFSFDDMSHCSCNGPWEGLNVGLDRMTRKDAWKALKGESVGKISVGFVDKRLVEAVKKASDEGLCPPPPTVNQ